MPLPSPSTENFIEYHHETTTSFPVTTVQATVPELKYSTATKVEVIPHTNGTDDASPKPKRKGKPGNQKGNKKKEGKRKLQKSGGKSNEKELSAEATERRLKRTRLRQERLERLEKKRQKRLELALKRKNRKKKFKTTTWSSDDLVTPASITEEPLIQHIASSTQTVDYSPTPEAEASSTAHPNHLPNSDIQESTPGHKPSHKLKKKHHNNSLNGNSNTVRQENPIGDQRMKDGSGFIVNAFVDDVVSGKLQATTTERAPVTENYLSQTTMSNKITKDEVWFGDLSCLNPFILAPESIGAHITYRR